MIDDPRVEELLEELLESGGSPEEACRRAPSCCRRSAPGCSGCGCWSRRSALFPPFRTPGLRPACAGAVRAAADPRLRGGGGAGPRRDGGRLPGAAPAAQPPRRPEDAPGRGLRRPEERRALPARGGGRGAAAAPEHRAGPRGRRAGRPAVLHHGVRRGRQPGPEAGRAARCRPARPRRWSATLAEAVAGGAPERASSTAT